jgi:hypothetical protein
VRFSLSFLCFILFFLPEISQGQKINGPYLTVAKDTINYGVIQVNSNGERILKVTNTGDADLIITYCSGSCGCTIPKCPDYNIASGKWSDIKITYDTKRLGFFSKTVTIKSNAINNTVYIKVIGEIVE